MKKTCFPSQGKHGLECSHGLPHSDKPSASSLRCTKQRSENTVTARASPRGQWQGGNLVKDNTTAKGLREEERKLEAQQTSRVRGQADLSFQRTYQAEILEAIQRQCWPMVPEPVHTPAALQGAGAAFTAGGSAGTLLYAPLLPKHDGTCVTPHINFTLSLARQYHFNQALISEK